MHIYLHHLSPTFQYMLFSCTSAHLRTPLHLHLYPPFHYCTTTPAPTLAPPLTYISVPAPQRLHLCISPAPLLHLYTLHLLHLHLHLHAPTPSTTALLHLCNSLHLNICTSTLCSSAPLHSPCSSLQLCSSAAAPQYLNLNLPAPTQLLCTSSAPTPPSTQPKQPSTPPTLPPTTPPTPPTPPCYSSVLPLSQYIDILAQW